MPRQKPDWRPSETAHQAALAHTQHIVTPSGSTYHPTHKSSASRAPFSFTPDVVRVEAGEVVRLRQILVAECLSLLAQLRANTQIQQRARG